jgi:hypothetical protein
MNFKIDRPPQFASPPKSRRRLLKKPGADFLRDIQRQKINNSSILPLLSGIWNELSDKTGPGSGKVGRGFFSRMAARNVQLYKDVAAVCPESGMNFLMGRRGCCQK